MSEEVTPDSLAVLTAVLFHRWTRMSTRSVPQAASLRYRTTLPLPLKYADPALKLHGTNQYHKIQKMAKLFRQPLVRKLARLTRFESQVEKKDITIF
jgi:hypothetical protein